jgi:tetratricopeptide (TPR) repeat protein
MREALNLLKDDPDSLRTFVQQLAEPRNTSADSVVRKRARALLAEHLASQTDTSAFMFELSGDLYAADQAWDQAIAAFTKAIASQPADVAVLTKIASAYQSAGRSREAVAHLATASLLNPADTLLNLKVSALQAWFRQDKEFAASRQKMLAFAKGTTDSITAERTAKACSLLPSTDTAELEAALELARDAVKLGEDSGYLPYFQMALGIAEFRIAHFAEADVALVAAVRGAKDNRIISGTSAFYQAMCLFRQGKADEARKLAVKTAAAMRPLPADELNPLAGAVSHDDLILWLAYKEAKTLIGFDGRIP